MLPLTARMSLIRGAFGEASRRRAGVVLALGLIGLLGGCRSAGVEGKIVDGPSSIVTLADVKDDRLGGAGVAGATAELRAVQAGMGDRLLGTSASDASGRFRMDVRDELRAEQLVLIVTRDGYVTAKGPVSISAGGKQVLVILKKTK